MHVGVTETEQNNHYKQSEGQIRILFHLKNKLTNKFKHLTTTPIEWLKMALYK